jgi:small subunit ribosomal protein S17
MTPQTQKKSEGKVLRGTVVKAAMKDTMTVAVTRYVKHDKYKKYFKTTKKFLVHDAGNKAQVDDVVDIVETRPISKRKNFILAKIVRTSAVEEK